MKVDADLEIGATYKVELDGDGVWGGEFTSKLLAIEQDTQFHDLDWLKFENGVRMTYNRACKYERQSDGKA